MEVDDVAPAISILNFLRQRLACVGTKEGCAEGDCGACTVVTGELRGNRLELKPVNACIQFLPTLDGKALFTVEGLRQKDGCLHPVQQALVECHGSQCGFCTPGFVMSLWGLYINCVARDASDRPGEGAVRQAITGNLCRCTGYRPIIDAGQRMLELPHVAFDRDAVVRALKSLVRHVMFSYEYQGQRFEAPRSVAELAALRAARTSSTILAGGTDVGLWVNKQFRELGDILYTGEVAELRKITDDSNGITIGAAASLNDAWAALKTHYPEMNEMWERFASPPIRNAGTLGGNIANGSPIGDAMPGLIVLGSQVTLLSTQRSRCLPLEDLYIGYQQTAMQPDEILTTVNIPRPTPDLRFRIYKVSKRYDSDISAVCGAFAITIDEDKVASCRIAFGGMAATPKRATCAEQILIGRKWDEGAVHSAMNVLSQDYTPLTDLRASADYRLKTARNLLFRYYLETRRAGAMTGAQLNVFA